MAKRSYTDMEENQEVITLAAFMKNYNDSVPEHFPRVTVALLNKFQASYPSLFDGSGNWSIDKHRKRVMDWVPAHKN